MIEIRVLHTVNAVHTDELELCFKLSFDALILQRTWSERHEMRFGDAEGRVEWYANVLPPWVYLVATITGVPVRRLCVVSSMYMKHLKVFEVVSSSMSPLCGRAEVWCGDNFLHT